MNTSRLLVKDADTALDLQRQESTNAELQLKLTQSRAQAAIADVASGKAQLITSAALSMSAAEATAGIHSHTTLMQTQVSRVVNKERNG